MINHSRYVFWDWYNGAMPIKEYASGHKKVTALLIILVISLVWMATTGTLSYPYIMAERQIQLLNHCVHPTTTFIADPFGYKVTIPKGYCALPHRIFPNDGTVQIVPEGYYFVLNEYTKGTVTESAVATLLFFPDKNGEEVGANIDALRRGKFLEEATYRSEKNPHEILITQFDNATGIIEGKRFDWAFTVHTEGKSSMTALTDKTNQTQLFNEILNGVEEVPAKL